MGWREVDDRVYVPRRGHGARAAGRGRRRRPEPGPGELIGSVHVPSPEEVLARFGLS